MTNDEHWQRELIAALQMENAFNAAPPEYLKPTRADGHRAVANIQAWRAYLPEPCVATMI